jgi:hypothetical protein
MSQVTVRLQAKILLHMLCAVLIYRTGWVMMGCNHYFVASGNGRKLNLIEVYFVRRDLI